MQCSTIQAKSNANSLMHCTDVALQRLNAFLFLLIFCNEI